MLFAALSDDAVGARPGSVLARIDVKTGLVAWAAPAPRGRTLVAGTTGYGAFYAASLAETGGVVWQDIYDAEGFDVAKVVDAAADPSGAVSVLVEHSDAKTGREDRTVVRYSSDGIRGWSRSFEDSCTPVALAVDRVGNTYVAGESRPASGPPDAYVARISPTGQFTWSRTYRGRGGAFSDAAQGVTVDSAGNVYVCGNTYGGVSRQSDALLLKYSESGRLLWSRTYHRPRSLQDANKCDTAFRVTLDRSGHVLLGGWSHLSKSDWDFLALKYTSGGGLVWARTYAGPKRGGRDLAQLLETDSKGNVYLAGESEGPLAKDFAVVSFSANGSRRWTFRFDGPDHLEDVPTALRIGPDGTTYMTGVSWTVKRQSEFATVAIGRSGALRWKQRWNAGPYQDRPNALWLDERGRLNVAGLIYAGEDIWDYQGVIVRLAP